MAKIVKLVCSLFSFCYESRERSLHSQVSVSLKSQIFPLKEMVKNSVFSVLSSVLVTSQEEVFTFLSRLVCVCVWYGGGGGVGARGECGYVCACLCVRVTVTVRGRVCRCPFVCARVYVCENGGVCICMGMHSCACVCAYVWVCT